MRHAARRGAGALLVQGRTGDLFAPPPAPAPVGVPEPRGSPVQLWLALWLARLPLVVVPSGAGGLRAVVADDGPRRVLVACNDAALALGLTAGLQLNAARVLAPALEVAERDARLEARHMERLACWALRFTPLVSLEPPAGLLLEVQGSLRLFGGLQPLLALAAAELAARGDRAALAVAPTPRAALWLARAAPGTAVESPARLAGTLARLPLAATHWPARALEDCVRLGVATLGELRRLPRDGLARRFGPALLAELDEAYGQRPAPRRRHVASERFEERIELPAELETAAALAPHCARLLERLERFLRVRDAGVGALAFTLLHREHRPSCVRLGRALPAADAAQWRGLLDERLGRLLLPAPVRALLLRSGAAVPVAATSAVLPGCAVRESEAAACALLDRLRARLGDEAVSGTRLVPEHRPEAAFRRVRPEPAPGTLAAALPLAPRPLWLLAVPEPLDLDDGRPCSDGALQLESGPERIESGWWDGAGIARDYYVARSARGARLWVFRPRSGERHWFLHGVFG